MIQKTILDDNGSKKGGHKEIKLARILGAPMDPTEISSSSKFNMKFLERFMKLRYIPKYSSEPNSPFQEFTGLIKDALLDISKMDGFNARMSYGSLTDYLILSIDYKDKNPINQTLNVVSAIESLTTFDINVKRNAIVFFLGVALDNKEILLENRDITMGDFPTIYEHIVQMESHVKSIYHNLPKDKLDVMINRIGNIISGIFTSKEVNEIKDTLDSGYNSESYDWLH